MKSGYVWLVLVVLWIGLIKRMKLGFGLAFIGTLTLLVIIGSISSL